MLKYVLFITFLSNLLIAKEASSFDMNKFIREQAQIVVSNADGSSSYVKNQFYVCFNTGTMVEGMFFPQEDKELVMNHPLRFYVDNKNILHTDAGIMANFISKKDGTALYGIKNTLFGLTPKKKKYLLMRTKLDDIEATIVYRCTETDNWTVDMDKN